MSGVCDGHRNRKSQQSLRFALSSTRQRFGAAGPCIASQTATPLDVQMHADVSHRKPTLQTFPPPPIFFPCFLGFPCVFASRNPCIFECFLLLPNPNPVLPLFFFWGGGISLFFSPCEDSLVLWSVFPSFPGNSGFGRDNKSLSFWWFSLPLSKN